MPACEYNPFEAVQTEDILRAKNVIDAAIDTGVRKVLAISTDKAAESRQSLWRYKALRGKDICSGQFVCRTPGAASSAVRDTVLSSASRGSVIPVFLDQRKTGVITITDEQAMRDCWITLEQGVSFVVKCIEHTCKAVEIFVPKIPSMRLIELAKAVAPECDAKIIRGFARGKSFTPKSLCLGGRARHAVRDRINVCHSAHTPFPGGDAAAWQGASHSRRRFFIYE